MQATEKDISDYVDFLKKSGVGKPEDISAYEQHLKQNYLSSPNAETRGEAFIQGVGQGGLFGYGPEVQSAVGGLIPDPSKSTNEELEKQGFKIQEPEYKGLTLQEARSRGQRLSKESPYSSFAGNVVGGLASGVGLSKGLEALKLVKPVTGFLSGMKQGAGIGAGVGLVTNPNEAPEDSGINMGARLQNMVSGGAIGGLLGGASGALINKFGKPIPPENKPITSAEDIQLKSPEYKKLEITEPVESLEPKNFKEIESQVSSMKRSGILKDSPTVERLDSIVKNNPDLPKPIPGIHDEMLKNKPNYEKIRTMAESPTSAGEQIRLYEQGMKQQAEKKIGDLISQNGERIPLEKMEAGENLMSSVKNYHDKVQDILSPVFEYTKDIRLPRSGVVGDVRSSLVKSIPELEASLKINKSGALELKPFDAKMGITRQAYSSLSDAVKSLNSKSLSLEDMQRIREYLRQSTDPTNPKSTAVLEKARRGMLDYMTDLVEKNSPQELDYRNLMKEYAINETNVSQAEQIIGGKLESLDQLLMANPERVLDKVFSGTNNIKVMQKVMGQKQFSELTKDYLYNLVQRSSDKGSLSSNKLNSLLKSKDSVLKSALNEVEYNRLKDLTDYMRLIPDTASPNPSGTARTSEILKKAAHGDKMGLLKESVGLLKDIGANSREIKNLNKMILESKTKPPVKRSGNIPVGLINAAEQGLLNE